MKRECEIRENSTGSGSDLVVSEQTPHEPPGRYRSLYCINFVLAFAVFVMGSIQIMGNGNDAFRIVIKKAERKLYLYRTKDGKEQLVKKYQIALGNNPTGHKYKQGDGATPEGDYYITHKNSRSNYFLSLGLSYPNINDADDGLKSGLITKEQHRSIVGAIENRQKPPQNTKLGGDIFIHGGGTGKLFGLIRDWTLGCVALENDEIKELFDTIPVKTPVRIEP